MIVNKKLTAYSSLATGLILAPELSKAQINTIVYTDIDPDKIFSG